MAGQVGSFPVGRMVGKSAQKGSPDGWWSGAWLQPTSVDPVSLIFG
jgi:hypothetical protein